MTRILVAGVAVLDFVYQVDELPRTAEKYRAQDMEIVGGGCAANAAVAIQRLGGQTELIARMADDQIGRLVQEDLKAEGVDLARLEVAENGRSSCSSIYVDAAGERQIMNFRGEALAQTPAAILKSDATAVLADTRWTEAAEAAFAFGRKAGLPCVLDGEAPMDADIAQEATHAVFSEQGIVAFTGEKTPQQALVSASESLPGWVAVTMGANGVAWIENNSIQHVVGFRVDVVDTLGAGDVWHGAFTLRLAEGASEHDATVFANATSALKCMRFGGRKATPTRTAVEQFLKDNV